MAKVTGLHDRNGKEIYEGDIMKTNAGGDQSVHFNEAQGMYGLWAPFTGTEHSWTVSLDYAVKYGWEVIGNINENPDLLR